VLVHPDHATTDPNALRLICRAVTPGEWPWTRLTGLPLNIPHVGTDLTDWPTQPLGDVAVLLGHRTVLSGHEVGRS
jgi:hypothetical protein